LGVVIFILLLFLYLIPTMVACNNKKENATAICVVNVLLGWMLIPWVLALCWACCRDKPRDIVQIFNDNHPGTLGYVRKDGK